MNKTELLEDKQGNIYIKYKNGISKIDRGEIYSVKKRYLFIINKQHSCSVFLKKGNNVFCLLTADYIYPSDNDLVLFLKGNQLFCMDLLTQQQQKIMEFDLPTLLSNVLIGSQRVFFNIPHKNSNKKECYIYDLKERKTLYHLDDCQKTNIYVSSFYLDGKTDLFYVEDLSLNKTYLMQNEKVISTCWLDGKIIFISDLLDLLPSHKYLIDKNTKYLVFNKNDNTLCIYDIKSNMLKEIPYNKNIYPLVFHTRRDKIVMIQFGDDKQIKLISYDIKKNTYKEVSEWIDMYFIRNYSYKLLLTMSFICQLKENGNVIINSEEYTFIKHIDLKKKMFFVIDTNKNAYILINNAKIPIETDVSKGNILNINNKKLIMLLNDDIFISDFSDICNKTKIYSKENISLLEGKFISDNLIGVNIQHKIHNISFVYNIQTQQVVCENDVLMPTCKLFDFFIMRNIKDNYVKIYNKENGDFVCQLEDSLFIIEQVCKANVYSYDWFIMENKIKATQKVFVKKQKQTPQPLWRL